MSELLKHIGATVRNLRKKQQLSIEGTAERADLHSTYLAQVEKGQRNLSVKALFQIAFALGVNPNSLLPENRVTPLKDSYLNRFTALTEKLNADQKDIVINIVKELTHQLKRHEQLN